MHRTADDERFIRKTFQRRRVVSGSKITSGAAQRVDERATVWGAFDPFVFSEPDLAIRLASLAIVLDSC